MPMSELRAELEDIHPEDLADALEKLDDIADVARVIRALSDETGAAVLERLSSDKQHEVLEVLHNNEAVTLISEMAPDDRVDFVQELPTERRDSILQELRSTAPEIAQELHDLVSYGKDTAGGLMTTQYVGLQPSLNVGDAIDEIRRGAKKEQAETVYYVYVLFGEKLVGVLSLRQILLSEPLARLEDIMETNVVRVAPTDDQETVAATIAKYDFSAIPVVDEHGTMLGVVTIDDVVDVVIQEATEDAQKAGGVVPLEDSYLQTPYFTFVWKRVSWLVILFFGGLMTASILGRYNNPKAQALSIFIPLIISAGGNTGSQSASLVIRAMAVGEVRLADWWRVFFRELAIGMALGSVLGGLGFLRAYFVGTNASADLALTVGLTVLAVVTTGALVGSLLPLVIRRAGLDPAVSSTPFVASLCDVMGLTLYFAIASWIFGVAFT